MTERKVCTNCYGSGTRKEREFVRCWSCGGGGRVFDFDREKSCSSCGGSGGREEGVDKPCFKCSGRGYEA